jgi:hypothetical protein
MRGSHAPAAIRGLMVLRDNMLSKQRLALHRIPRVSRSLDAINR